MKARKYGQGYAENQAGMIIQAPEGDNPNSYKERILRNSMSAAGTLADSLGDRSKAYNLDKFQQTTTISQANDNLNSVKGQDVKDQSVDNQYVQTLTIGSINGASTGGFVTGSGIQHFATGGIAGKKDTVPAMLRPGEAVITPEGLKKSAESLNVTV
ncbi:MAG: hypothetical protein IKP65_05185 [Alphaproteobacteria bacterium]|nr:hypothetical protein [Alphaproteobacteria bacterium]